MISENLKTDISDLRDDYDKIKTFLAVVESHPPQTKKQASYIIDTLIALHDSLNADIACLEFCENGNDHEQSLRD